MPTDKSTVRIVASGYLEMRSVRKSRAVMNDADHARHPAPAPRAKAFVAASVLICLATLALAAATNYVVNPYAWYAPQILRPRAQLTREAKVAQLRQAAEPPPGLILGSSRVMQIEPAYVQTKTDYAFYNAGVSSAIVEDYLAMLRFYLNTFHRPPRMILLGIDVLAFAPRPINGRLLQVPELSRTIASLISVRDRFLLLAKLLSWHQTTASLRALLARFSQGSPKPLLTYLPDGTYRYVDIEKQKAPDATSLSRHLSVDKIRLERDYTSFPHLSPARQNALKTFLTLCHDLRIQLAIFLTPLHPDVLKHLAERTEYLSRRHELEAFLHSLSSTYSFSFLNLTEIKSFKGLSKNFEDGIHYLKLNSQRIIDEIDRRIGLKDS